MFVVITFTGCGKTQLEKAQSKIVSIGEQFLDYELTIDEAKEQLESIVVPPKEKNAIWNLDNDKSHLEYLILKSRNNSTVIDEIEGTIQNIKKRKYE